MENQITRNTEWKDIPYKTSVGEVVDLAQTVTIDKTLTVSDAAADAKVVGDKLNGKIDLSGGVIHDGNPDDARIVINTNGISGFYQGNEWKIDSRNSNIAINGKIQFPMLKSGNETPFFDGTTFDIGCGSNGKLNLPFVTDGKYHNLALVDDISAAVNPVQDPSFNIKVATIAGKDINIPKASSTTIRRWYN